ncbi:MAG: serine O-acetyltransferase [Actinobacteria bacterium]|nr:serine O-acetyltransferase [Actinomycetota bacterium]
MKDDLQSVAERDPAARTQLEVALLYPGVHAVWAHRVSHALWRRGVFLPARTVSQATRFLTGIEIHPGATLGPRLFIDHGSGVVIGETAEVGADVTIYHGVTLGGTSLDHGKRHPTVGDRVTVGAGAKVLGPVNVGHDSRIGANAVLVRSVDSHSVVVGVPGQVIAHGTSATTDTKPKQDSPSAPDPVGLAVSTLLVRVDRLETQVLGHERHMHEGPQRLASGDWEIDWEVTDFSI